MASKSWALAAPVPWAAGVEAGAVACGPAVPATGVACGRCVAPPGRGRLLHANAAISRARNANRTGAAPSFIHASSLPSWQRAPRMRPVILIRTGRLSIAATNRLMTWFDLVGVFVVAIRFYPYRLRHAQG